MEVSELRRVRLFFRASPYDNPTEHFMHESQVQACVLASVELHFWPGVNPYSKGKTSELWRIEVGELTTPTDYWHTTPGLGKVKGKEGAKVSRWTDKRAWTNPDLKKQEAVLEELDD